ncbi:MAG: plastocyanin/azurin family copper-binding protein [Agriterribacter sp.]
MKKYIVCLAVLFSCARLYAQQHDLKEQPESQTRGKVDREYVFEAKMTGFLSNDGTRNPVVRAKKGERVRITIVNGELMTHDIAIEKLNIKTKTIIEKGAKTAIVFTATQNDTYFCSIPGHRVAGMVGKIVISDNITAAAATPKGKLPVKDGKPLNLNFEKGTLQDWTAGGDAFTDGIIAVDSSQIQAKYLPINKEGKYFVSSGGMTGHAKTGTLTSVAFKVTQPYAAFKVSGGALQDTRVELVRKDDDSVFFQIPGTGRATLRPVVVDLRKLLNKEIYIRLIDNETGISPIPYIEKDIWSHINFDDFEFYTTRPKFDNELSPSDIVVLPPLDPIKYSGLSGEKAAEAIELPEGFSVTLAASEPQVIKPIAFTIDWKGRLWVVESRTYPVRAPQGQGKDIISIFEDTDGDGKLDSKKIFLDTMNLVSGIEVGMGGVWVGAAPNLLFIPFDINTDKPTGPAEIVLDGWGYEDTHETLNSLQWGPDGWLYGTHGVFTHSNVGKPGTPANQRVKVDACVWRIHPITKKFEIFAEGTSNPWGVDFNDYGHAFITACVVPHLYHMIQGGRYIRQGGKHPEYTYGDLQNTADHVHWVGDRGPHAGNGRSASKGGGHAHAGAMFYLGGDNWPAQYRNDIFMNSIHGSRVDIDEIVRKGSGYVGHHGKDFLLTNDAWSQWLNFRYDASGSIYAIDWCDKNQCHSPNPDVHDKSLGRIFKVSNVKDKFIKVDLSKATDLELVENQLNRNDWYVRQSRILLEQRGPSEQVHIALKKILTEHPDVTRKLRALWALHVTKGLKEEDLIQLLNHESEYLRSWAIQLLVEDSNPSDAALARFATMAKFDTSAMVRLYLASAMQRTSPEKRLSVVESLYQHSEDKDDSNLPLMIWYAFEPLVPANAAKALEIAKQTALPNTLKFTAMRIKAMNTDEAKAIIQQLITELSKGKGKETNHDILMAISDMPMKH